MPTRVHLCGDVVRLEPMGLEHVDDLLAAAQEDRSSYGYTLVPARADTMRAYVEHALAEERRGVALPFVTRLASGGRVVGSTRVPRHRVLDRVVGTSRRHGARHAVGGRDRVDVAGAVGAAHGGEHRGEAADARPRLRRLGRGASDVQDRRPKRALSRRYRPAGRPARGDSPSAHARRGRRHP